MNTQLLKMDGNDIVLNTIFVDTNLDTHMAIIVSDTVTVLQLKDKIVLEHLQCFPNIGEIKINALKVKRKGYFYHLADSMLVRSAFDGLKKNWFLAIDVSKAEVDIPGLNIKAGIDNGNPTQKPDTKSDHGNNNPESLLPKYPAGASDVGNNSMVEPSYIQKEPEKPHPGLTDVDANKGVSGRSLGVEESLMSSRGWFPKITGGEVTVDSRAGYVPESGVDLETPGVGIVKQGDTVAGSVAGVSPEPNMILKMAQKESPELKNNATAIVPLAKAKRKYIKRKADADPDQEAATPKVVQKRGRKVTPKMPNIHDNSLPANAPLDQGLPLGGGHVSGKMEKTGTDPITGSSDQIKVESGIDDGNTHLTVNENPSKEIVTSIVGSRKAGKKKSSTQAVVKKSPIKKGNKVGAQTPRVEPVSTGDGEKESLTGHQKGAADGPYLRNQTGSEKKKDDEEKGKSVIIPKDPDDRDVSGKSTKTQKGDMEVALSAVEAPEKSGAVCEPKASVDSGEVSRSSGSDSDSSEKTMSGDDGQSKAEGYPVVAKGMEEAKAGEIVLEIPSSGLELASNHSRDLLGRAGTGSPPERKEKKKIKKTIARPPPLITEETSDISGLNRDNVISKLGEGKRRKVKPKNRDISHDITSAEPPVDRIVSPYSGIGSGKIEKIGTDPVNGGSSGRKHELVPGDGIVHPTIDVKPTAEVEISVVGLRKKAKKKTRQEKAVSLDHVDANEGHPPGSLSQKGGGANLDLSSPTVLKKRREDGEEKAMLENYVARNEHIPDVVGIAITEPANGVSNSNDNSKYRADTGVLENKDKKKCKKRKTDSLPLITEDKSCVGPFPEKESVPSEAGDGKRRKVKPKKQKVPDDNMPPDGGDGKIEKTGTDYITGGSAERKPEPTLGGKISHLNIEEKRGAEDKSFVGIKKGGKKKNLVPEDTKNTLKNTDPKNTPKNKDQKNIPKNTLISDKGKKTVAPWREESVSTDESRKVTKTHGIKVTGSAVVEPLKDDANNNEWSETSNSDSDISEKTSTRGNGGLSNDYRIAPRVAEMGIPGEVVAGLNEEKSWVGIPSGGTHGPSYDSPSASSETTSTNSRDTPQQGNQRREEREGSRDSSPLTPKKGNVKLEVILRSSTRFKKMKVASDEIPDTQPLL